MGQVKGCFIEKGQKYADKILHMINSIYLEGTQEIRLSTFSDLIGGPYSVFAGRDASRALATFDVHSTSEEYDDLSDLKQSELNEVKEWDLQFSEKYTLVGKLLKPGEQPTSYSDDEGTDDEAAIEEENRKLKRLSSGQKLPKDDQEEEIQND